MKKVTRLLLVASVAAMGVGGFGACTDDVTVVQPPPPEPPPPPPPEDAELTIKSVEDFEGDNVDPTDVEGSVVVVYNVESGDKEIDEIQVVIDGVAQTCQTVSGSGSVSGVRASASGQAGQQEVECVLATDAAASECVGEQIAPAFDNGEHTIGGNLILTDGSSTAATNDVTLVFDNDNFVMLAREGGQGILEPVSDDRFYGGEDIIFHACPVYYDGTVVDQLTLLGTDLGGDSPNAVDLDADGNDDLGDPVTSSSPFSFTAALADNMDLVEDPAGGAGHEIEVIDMETAEGLNLPETTSMILFLDWTGPQAQDGDEEVFIDGAAAVDGHYSAGDFSIEGAPDLGVGTDFAATVFDIVDAADIDDVLFGDAAGVTDATEDDNDAYHARVDVVVDRLGNPTTVDADADGDLDTEAPALTVVDWGVDVTAPDITDEAPVAGTVLNDVALEFEAEDPDLASGDPGSGLDMTGCDGAIGGTACTAIVATDEDDETYEVDGNSFLVDIADAGGNGSDGPLADGAHTIAVDVPDLAIFDANVAMTTFDFILDTTPPSFGALDPAPGGSSGTDATSIIQTIGGTITDANVIAEAIISVFADGTDAEGTGGNGVCDAASDYLLDVDDGEIDRNEVDITSGTSDISFNEAFEIFEPPSGSVTVTYCFIIEATDEAVDRDGDDNGNMSDLATEADVTWNG